MALIFASSLSVLLGMLSLIITITIQRRISMGFGLAKLAGQSSNVIRWPGKLVFGAGKAISASKQVQTWTFF